MPPTDNIHDPIILGSGPADVTAAGSGCMAALQAERYLESHSG